MPFVRRLLLAGLLVPGLAVAAANSEGGEREAGQESHTILVPVSGAKAPVAISTMAPAAISTKAPVVPPKTAKSKAVSTVIGVGTGALVGAGLGLGVAVLVNGGCGSGLAGLGCLLVGVISVALGTAVGATAGGIYGAPRNVMTTLRYNF